MNSRADLSALLSWQIAAGADEAIGDAPLDRFVAVAGQAAAPRAMAPPPAMRVAPAPALRPVASPAYLPPAAGVGAARTAAAAATNLAELRAAVEAFDGCALKKTATNTVFADGVPDAKLMFVGEAPGGDEDRIGRPFVGASGQLLDRMLSFIGVSRQTNFYITNIAFWRPPGNREPSSEEVALCLPFVHRHIELLRPSVLVCVGGPSAKNLLGKTEGITRLRGRWFEFRTPAMAERGEAAIPAFAMLHPAYLLRTPAAKREAWRDLLTLKSRLVEAGVLG